MKDEAVDLAHMRVEDLFEAKSKRRERLSNLPFEEKIRIVKKLQSVYPLTQVGFLTLVNDLLVPICLDLGIHMSRRSGAMFPHYVRGQWLYDVDNRHAVTIMRWLFGREERVEGWQESDFKPRLAFGAELRMGIDRLFLNNEKVAQNGFSQKSWREKLPISFRTFDAANGRWIAEWLTEPTEADCKVHFDIRFNRDLEEKLEKLLHLQVSVTALSND